jgi:class 3 adenylate cyclase
LVAILAADVVGYSALMGADEARALAALKLLREELFEPQVARWRGAVVKRLGDGWLVEFPSVVDAVGCAVAVQGRMAEVPGVALRIGIHIGDIVHQGGDIFGNGVNVAARLEMASAPGHVLISDDVRRQISGRIDAAFHEVGPVALKNIAEPVRVWSWPEALTDLSIVADAGRKPGIHVAQFEARGAEAVELAEAVRGDLATAFARQSGVDLITDAEAADYIVAGAIRGAGDRWRISAGLTDRVNGQTVWSDRFDETGGDPFDIQDRCVTRIAGAVRIRLPSLLAGKLAEKPLQSMTVEELLNHAMNRNFTPTVASWDQSDSALQLVLQRDPDNWMAMAMLCWNLLARSVVLGWRQMGAADAAVARGLIKRAQTLKPNSEVVRMAQGALLLYVARDHGAARIGRRHESDGLLRHTETDRRPPERHQRRRDDDHARKEGEGAHDRSHVDAEVVQLPVEPVMVPHGVAAERDDRERPRPSRRAHRARPRHGRHGRQHSYTSITTAGRRTATASRSPAGRSLESAGRSPPYRR